MTGTQSIDDIASAISADLPYLRRFARALTGSQAAGDRYAIATLEAILADPAALDAALAPKVALFKAFNAIWGAAGGQVEPPSGASPEARAQARLAGLTRNTREALLLHSIEGFTNDQIGEVIGTTAAEAGALVDTARREMANGLRGNVLVIEDEAIIAMDISAIVEAMGHRVAGVARTRDGAVDLARTTPPDLVLADIQLADKSSGIDAVKLILEELGELPVVFITAFPERLLTGERPEPAFLITKPYAEEQVRSAVSQAMFFASTETLNAPG